ncbi:MAG: hypothetical protein OS112_03565 [Methanoregula sp.]|nr:MAG: hypothetical protein OS112_03565 [Methanoregula sp.]
MRAKGIGGKDLSQSNLIGFGSGIYFAKHHKELLMAIAALPALAGKNVFVFSTAGSCAAWFLFHRAIKKEMAAKGGVLAGEFCCKGYDTYGLFGKFGGINKGHPDVRDICRAVTFAKKMAGMTN